MCDVFRNAIGSLLQNANGSACLLAVCFKGIVGVWSVRVDPSHVCAVYTVAVL